MDTTTICCPLVVCMFLYVSLDKDRVGSILLCSILLCSILLGSILYPHLSLQEDIFQHDESDDLPGKRRAVGPQPSAAASPRTEPSPMEPPPIEGISGHQGGAHDMAEEDAEGFVMDEASGLLYNSARGLFFDPGSQRFRDAHTGKWFAAAPC